MRLRACPTKKDHHYKNMLFVCHFWEEKWYSSNPPFCSVKTLHFERYSNCLSFTSSTHPNPPWKARGREGGAVNLSPENPLLLSRIFPRTDRQKRHPPLSSSSSLIAQTQTIGLGAEEQIKLSLVITITETTCATNIAEHTVLHKYEHDFTWLYAVRTFMHCFSTVYEGTVFLLFHVLV